MNVSYRSVTAGLVWTLDIFYLFIYLSISIYLSIYLSISIYLFINQSTDISIYLGLSCECIEDQGHYWVGVDTGHRLSIYLFLFIYLSLYLGLSGKCMTRATTGLVWTLEIVYPSICFYLSIYLSIYV